MAERYGLGDPSYFAYLNQSGCYDVPGVDDNHDFECLLKQRALSFSDSEVEWMMELVAVVLHTSNVTCER